MEIEIPIVPCQSISRMSPLGVETSKVKSVNVSMMKKVVGSALGVAAYSVREQQDSS
jgi:hypothetical protein